MDRWAPLGQRAGAAQPTLPDAAAGGTRAPGRAPTHARSRVARRGRAALRLLCQYRQSTIRWHLRLDVLPRSGLEFFPRGIQVPLRRRDGLCDPHSDRVEDGVRMGGQPNAGHRQICRSKSWRGCSPWSRRHQRMDCRRASVGSPGLDHEPDDRAGIVHDTVRNAGSRCAPRLRTVVRGTCDHGGAAAPHVRHRLTYAS